MKKYLFLFFLFVLFLNGCFYTCEDVKEHSLSLVYNFKITKKQQRKFIVFNGYDKYNNPVEFKEGEYWDIYDFVEIGDTLFKELGKTELVLIKMDTTLVFPLKCRGKILE